MITRVKLCGVTRLEDALRATALGVDAIGFNFVSGSPRRIAPGDAATITEQLPSFVLRVGVFADEPRASLRDTARRARLHCIQFHGEEDPGTCARAPLPWYKAHRLRPGFDLKTVRDYPEGTFLLDAYRPGLPGGTGRTCDWDVARRAAGLGRLILAGGLGPDNVLDAINTVRPYAVDVNSGVESSPGCKDPERLAQFMQQVARAGRASRETM